MKTRDKLLSNLNTSVKRLRAFSCPEFNGVYSNQYFKYIIKNSINNYKNTYSVIFGDFNKLGIINDVYGHEFGDKALKYSIEIIKQCLPSNAMIVRAGGDEFYIIIPDCVKETADMYCNKIRHNFDRNLTLVGGLSIELASADSTLGNIDELINMADIEVTNIKSNKKDGNSPVDILPDDFLSLNIPDSISLSERQSWNELNKQINNCTYNFLQNFRPSKTLNFEQEQITDASDFITTNFAYLLGKKLDINFSDSSKSAKYLDEQKCEPIKQENKGNKENSNDTSNINNLNSNISGLIHTLVTRNKKININNFSDKELTHLNSLINKLVESLIRDKTHLLSKQYFRIFLAKHLSNPNQQLSASYASICGIKLSNLAFDHSFTDYRLDKTNELFLDAVNEQLKYNDSSFNHSLSNIHLISQGAGNYLFLYTKKLSEEMNNKIKTIVDKVNSLSDINDSNSSFKMAYYCVNNKQNIPQSTANDLLGFVRALKEETNYKKDSIKKQLFKSTDAFVAFKKSINTCIDYYLKYIPDAATDVNKMVNFIKNVHMSFLNQEVLHNTTKHSKKTTGIGENDDDLII